MTTSVHQVHRTTWIGAATAAFITIAGFAGSASAADALVDVAFAKANAGKAGVVFVDARPQVDFLRGHIPGAVHTDYVKDGWRVNKGKAIAQLPDDPAVIGILIGKLGIDNSTHVVLVANGTDATDMGTATRLFWTFKLLGDDNVSVLNGGMKAYLAEVDKQGKPVNPLETGPGKVTPKAFKVSLRKEMLATRDEVKKAMDSHGTLIDNRPADQYLGVNQAPVDAVAGTIPGAHSVPENWITKNDSGTFRTKEELAKLYKAAGVATSGEQINFCNTGHWASLGWFASTQILGNKDAKLYAGSMTDWTHANMPVESKVEAK